MLCVFCLLSACCSGCRLFYETKITIEIPDSEDVIIIKEWAFLLGSGAEIYYKKPYRFATEIGTTSGADNGYCPFKNGEYSYAIHEDSIYIRWRTSWRQNTQNWKSKTFEFPD